MDASASQEEHGIIVVTLPKGAILVLSVEDYRLALQRGKARQRALRRAARAQDMQAKAEADTLNWIE